MINILFSHSQQDKFLNLSLLFDCISIFEFKIFLHVMNFWTGLAIEIVIEYLNIVLCVLFQLYKFGETVSICFWTDTWQPDSFYDKIASNREKGMHTLCLLGRSTILFLCLVSGKTCIDNRKNAIILIWSLEKKEFPKYAVNGFT